MSGHGLGAPPMPPRVAAYLHKVATLPTEELRHFAHHWHGEALGQFASDFLKHREQGAPQHRDIGGPVMPGAMMPMMAGNPNSRRQVSWLEQMPIEQLRELAFRASGSPMGAIVAAVLNKRMAMPALVGDAGQQPAQAPAQAAPQPAQGFSAAPMAPAASPPPTAPAVPGGASNPWDSLVSTSARGGRIPHRATGGYPPAT